jgi:L,D-transpeptidase YcbB
MTTTKAVIARAWRLPTAATLLLLGSLAAHAEVAPAADKAAAATQKDAKDATTADKKPEAPAQAATDKSAVPDPAAKDSAAKDSATAEGKDAASTDKKPGDTAAKPDTGSAADTAKAEPAKTPAQTDGGKVNETAKTEPAKAEPAKTEPAKKVDAPATTAALPDAAGSASAAGVSDQALPPADAIVADVRQMIPDATKGSNADDVAALAAFYEELSGPAIWVSTSGLTAKGKSAVQEIGKADDWGLRATDFDVPHIADGTLVPEAAAAAEIKVAQAVLKYARYARGGRINPASISQLMDQSPTLKAPKSVLTEIATAPAPDAYLRSLHPKHEQFERLRQVLLKLRGGSEEKEEQQPEEEEPALGVKLPPGRLLSGGMEDPQVSLLRKRLKVPADDAAHENVYDDKLQAAVRDFQRTKGLRQDALVGNNTRALLNGQPKPVAAVVTPDSKIERILINMERWRWEPDDLGDFYVWDNVPEFLTRVVKNGKVIHSDKIIVGQPSWPTPIFSADMKTIVFHPSWGVPDGIKRKELAPLLRKSTGGAGLFGIFGGGYSAQAVLDAYQLKAFYNGRQIDPNQVDWSSANIAAYSFQQPPGPKNVLGDVKFMFPNKHDVYMHDTPERNLFVKSFRALSHGCMRVEDPRRLAEVLLGEDKGWSPQKVQGMFRGYSADVPLTTHIPVHITYFTARVDDSGRLLTFADFYGLDSRTAAALTGRSVRFEQPAYADDEVASSSDPEEPSFSSGGYPPSSGYPPGASRQSHKKQYQSPASLADAITDIFSP